MKIDGLDLKRGSLCISGRTATSRTSIPAFRNASTRARAAVRSFSDESLAVSISRPEIFRGSVEGLLSLCHFSLAKIQLNPQENVGESGTLGTNAIPIDGAALIGRSASTICAICLRLIPRPLAALSMLAISSSASAARALASATARCEAASSVASCWASRFNLATSLSEIVWRCSERAKTVISASHSPPTPKIAITTKHVRNFFQRCSFVVSSAIQPIRKKKPNTNTAIWATVSPERVASLDNDETTPISLYSLAAVVFTMAQIVIVMIVLIRRTLRKR